MKKRYFNWIGSVALLILAGVLLFQLCRTTNQAMPSFVIETSFVGEYSIDGSEWKTFDKNTRLSAFDGDLLLRGTFDEFMPMELSFYLNHIGVSISVNGEKVFESGRTEDEMPEMICGSNWSGWSIEDVTEEDEIEIRLHNPHNYGNANAYNEFIDSMYLGGGIALQSHIEQECRFYWVAGIVVIVVAVALLGMALGYLAQRLPSGGLLWSLGMLSLFAGGYILMDNIDIFFRSNLIIFNTCVRQYTIMFAALAFVSCIRKTLTGRSGKIAEYLEKLMMATDGLLLILSLTDVLAIYDTGLYWAIVQGVVSLILFGLCIREYCQKPKTDRIMLISYMILLVAVLLELVDGRIGLWTSGIVVKIVFILLLGFHLVRGVKLVAINHRESAKAKELADQLRNNRIVLAMSQIRTHFIFNVLTAISGMCEYDPQKADETLIRFSHYLRNNIDIMEEDGPETFSKSLEHLEDYIALEQVRFGEKIQFVKELEVTDFMIPPLILQPLAENAIKHGLLPKPCGGTIKLGTQVDGGNIIITIEDDGVGFDVSDMEQEGSVGLKNVRFRLAQMANGSMKIESSPGNGTKVTITIPRD